MSAYQKYATSVVGVHGVPRWYEAPDHLVKGNFTDAHFRAAQTAILEQAVR